MVVPHFFGPISMYATRVLIIFLRSVGMHNLFVQVAVWNVTFTNVYQVEFTAINVACVHRKIDSQQRRESGWGGLSQTSRLPTSNTLKRNHDV